MSLFKPGIYFTLSPPSFLVTCKNKTKQTTLQMGMYGWIENFSQCLEEDFPDLNRANQYRQLTQLVFLCYYFISP